MVVKVEKRQILDEKKLIERLQNDKTRNYAFHQLTVLYQERIYWMIRKMVVDHEDANDVTQDVFIKVYQKIDSFRADAQLFTWIYRIATNECLSFLRKQKRRMFFSFESYHDVLENKLKENHAVTEEDVTYKLQQALLTLPDKQRLVFQMKYFEDLKYSDISTVLNTSVGGLKASYHHAVKKIEKFLSED
jgi:RNA polymerase sigma factor (sigma-70 family)